MGGLNKMELLKGSEVIETIGGTTDRERILYRIITIVNLQPRIVITTSVNAIVLCHLVGVGGTHHAIIQI